MKAAFAPSHHSGSKTLYALTSLVLAATGWAYVTPIDISVHARGIVRPKGDPVRIISEVSGRIRHLYTKEGSSVREGDVLLQLDTRDLLLKQRTLESRIHYTELRLADLQRQVTDATAIEGQSASIDVLERETARRNARAGLENARLRLARTDSLLEQGLIARQVYDDARLALEQAEAEESRLSAKSTELKRAQGEAHLRDLIAGATPLRAELAALYNELAQTRLEINRFSLTSPVDGQVTSFASLHTGEILSAGTTIAAIVRDSQSVLIESWLPAAERPFVKLDQRVRLQTESFPPDQYNASDGAVLSISPDARFNESLTSAFRVLITPDPFNPELHLGMTFEVHFITRQERLLWLLFQRIRRNFDG